MSILVKAPLWHLICTNFLQWCLTWTFLVLFGTNLHCIWCKFSIMISKIDAWTSICKGAIWDKFSEQHRRQSINKHNNSQKVFFFRQKRWRFNADFSWASILPRHYWLNVSRSYQMGWGVKKQFTVLDKRYPIIPCGPKKVYDVI